MERCIDCNSVLTQSEKVCPTCHKEVGPRRRRFGEFLSQSTRGVFYGCILALIVSRVLADANFIIVLGSCVGAMIVIVRLKAH